MLTRYIEAAMAQAKYTQLDMALLWERSLLVLGSSRLRRRSLSVKKNFAQCSKIGFYWGFSLVIRCR